MCEWIEDNNVFHNHRDGLLIVYIVHMLCRRLYRNLLPLVLFRYTGRDSNR